MLGNCTTKNRLFVDASFVSIEIVASTAGVLFDEEGQWVMGWQKNIYTRDSLHAKILAIAMGLQLAKAQKCERITIYTDCKNALSEIKENARPIDFLTDSIYLCRELQAYKGLSRK